LPQHLPKPGEVEDLIDARCTAIVGELQLKTEQQLFAVDKRLIQIRTQFDMKSLREMIINKADLKHVDSLNNAAIASTNQTIAELKSLQSELNQSMKSQKQISLKIGLLEQVRHDVLVGKRNTNCISCSEKADKYMPSPHRKGKDGK